MGCFLKVMVRSGPSVVRVIAASLAANDSEGWLMAALIV